MKQSNLIKVDAIKLLQDTNISVQHVGASSVTASGSAFSFFKAYEATAQDNTPEGIYAFLHNKERAEFAGATEEQVQAAFNGTFDTTKFVQARNALAGKLTKIASLDALKALKRKRIMSEYEGELDFDRIYDLYPFFSTKRESNGAIKAINVVVHFNFRGSVGASEIEQFGATTWAVVDMLERAGIQCNVTLRYHTTPGEKGAVDIEQKTVNVLVKEAGQYIDTLNLARCFTPWFYRKCIWNVSALAAEYVGNTLNSYIGRSFEHKSFASAGNIELGSDIFELNQKTADKLERYIKKALLADQTE